MKGLLLLITVAVCGIVFANVNQEFNSNIAWYNDIDQAKEAAAAQKKPLFVLLHKDWCGACKKLKTSLAQDSYFEQLSKHFVMMNTDQELSDAFNIDGGYIPRIFFAVRELNNAKASPTYKYYYADGQAVTDGMKAALQHFSPGTAVEEPLKDTPAVNSKEEL